ncbi:MAG: hypothetical protein KF770_01805 [Anaerolineae bacterium]|nr:hypothetical protein [Anaerolineae bacterium]
MKKVALFFIAIAAVILGITTAYLLTGPGDYERLRLTEAYVCPDGSHYRFSTRTVPFLDPQTGVETTGVELTVDCVAGEVVALAGVTRQAEGLFRWLAIGGWFVALMILWLVVALVGWLRPSAATPAAEPIMLTAVDQEQVLAHLQSGHKIEAVKHVRAVTGRSLADAKAHVEEIESAAR